MNQYLISIIGYAEYIVFAASPLQATKIIVSSTSHCASDINFVHDLKGYPLKYQAKIISNSIVL
jgi:hypothetical protein